MRQFVDQGHDVLLYHRGKTEADLPKSVRHTRHSLAAMPVLGFPHELLAESFDAVVHMIPMGEADSRAAMKAFRGRTARVVALSSGDVYRAYGRLTGTEPGPIEEGLLHEDSPLRSVLYLRGLAQGFLATVPCKWQTKSDPDHRHHCGAVVQLASASPEIGQSLRSPLRCQRGS